MVIVNTSDGSTTAFDLTDEDQRSSLQALIDSGQVTALSLYQDGGQASLPQPKGWGLAGRMSSPFGAELVRNGAREVIGERIYAQVGDVRVSLTLTFKSKLIRCDLARTGRMLYNPSRRAR